MIHPVKCNLDRTDENDVLVYIRVIPTRFQAYISDSDRNLPWRATPRKKVSRLTGIQIIPTDTEVGSLQKIPWALYETEVLPFFLFQLEDQEELGISMNHDVDEI